MEETTHKQKKEANHSVDGDGGGDGGGTCGGRGNLRNRYMEEGGLGGGGGDVLRGARETKKNAGENGHCHHLTSSEARTLESPSARKAPTPTWSTVHGCPAV